MSALEDLADALARDTIDEAERQNRPDLVDEVAKQLAATSTTMEEAYLTAIRVRQAERRARLYLQRQAKNFGDS